MIDTWISQGITFLITFLSKEEHMLFIGGLVLGIILGGAGAYIYFNVTNQLVKK